MHEYQPESHVKEVHQLLKKVDLTEKMADTQHQSKKLECPEESAGGQQGCNRASRMLMMIVWSGPIKYININFIDAHRYRGLRIRSCSYITLIGRSYNINDLNNKY